ncbi:MAG: T9SS type A sorting domain-containing protein [Bacteroidota bacterium]
MKTTIFKSLNQFKDRLSQCYWPPDLYRLLVFLLFLIPGLTLKGQSLSNQVFANGGQFIKNDQVGSFTWTIGELFTTTFKNEGTLTQGFQQGYNIVITDVQTFGKESIQFTIYPNPAIDRFFVEPSEWRLKTPARLYNLVGQPLQQLMISGKTEVDLSNYPSGIYLLEIKNSEGLPSLFKIQKR